MHGKPQIPQLWGLRSQRSPTGFLGACTAASSVRHCRNLETARAHAGGDRIGAHLVPALLALEVARIARIGRTLQKRRIAARAALLSLALSVPLPGLVDARLAANAQRGMVMLTAAVALACGYGPGAEVD